MTDLLVIHNAYLHTGGEEAVVDNEVALLRRKGLSVELRQYNNQTGIAGAWAALQAPIGLGLEAQAEMDLRRLKPRILHTHNLFPSLSPRIFTTAKAQGTKVVQTLHNFRPLCLNGLFLTPRGEICERCAPGNYLPGILRGCYRGSRIQSTVLSVHLSTAGNRQRYRTVDRFIAPSAFLRNKYIQYGFPEDRTVVQGHFLPEMPEEAPAIPKGYLLYVGRLSKEKGVSWLLDQYGSDANLPPLVIAGTGPLRSHVEKCVSRKVSYIGYVSGDEKTRWVREALALVVPSLCFENFPMAVAEANASGVPAIVADHGGMREMIQPGLNGERFIPGNGVSFREALSRLTTGTESAAYRQRIQENANQRFSADHFADTRIHLYENLLGISAFHTVPCAS